MRSSFVAGCLVLVLGVLGAAGPVPAAASSRETESAADAPSSPTAEGPDEPLPTELVEKTETRIVQVDVSVIDGKRNDRRSVPNLTKEMFRLRIDNKPPSPEEYARIAFDPICQETQEELGLPPELVQRSLIMMLDFNFLNGEKRFNIARAFRRLAEEGLPAGYRYKLVGYYRSVYEIIPFTTDARALLDAAHFLETSNWAGGPGPGEVQAPSELGEDLFPSLDDGQQAPASFSRFDGPDAGLDELTEVLGDISESPAAERTRNLGWDPRGSLGAIEAVLRGHAGLRGRKALIVFTGEAFELPFEDLQKDTRSVLEAAQFGFTIWMVDAQGFASTGADPEALSPRSRLVTMLANDTGGETLRSAPELDLVFERARDALDCYYLFSIPVQQGQKGRNLNVNVSLDTRTYPELWGFEVKHRHRIRLENKVERRERSRVAALLNPDGWNSSEARAELAFPLEYERKLTYLPVEVSVPLRSLDFQPRPNGGIYTEFLLDAAVLRYTGRGNQIACLYPRKGKAVVHTVSMARPLSPESRGHLVVRDLCPYKGRGLYSLRTALTNTETDALGAAHAVVEIDPRPGEELEVSSLRVGHNTGEEILVFHPEGLEPSVVRDAYRTAFIPLVEDDAVRRTDRVMFRYVVCGPSREEAKKRIRRLVYRKQGDEILDMRLIEAPETFSPEEDYPEDSFCVEVQDAVAPNELETPGDYGFAVVAQVGSGITRSQLASALAGEEGPGLLGHVEFRVD